MRMPAPTFIIDQISKLLKAAEAIVLLLFRIFLIKHRQYRAFMGITASLI